MHWTFPQMVAYASRDSVVLAGDLLASGTTGGGGCLAELWGRTGSQTPPPLEPGDEVRMEVEGIGSLDRLGRLRVPDRSAALALCCCEASRGLMPLLLSQEGWRHAEEDRCRGEGAGGADGAEHRGTTRR